MKKTYLDIGCGNHPKGDVNCDLFSDFTPHIMEENRINPKKIPNFVICDALHLPFKDNSFDIVNASEVLEHMIDPSKFIGEMKRISREIVTLDVPNLRRLHPEENPHHLYTWSIISLCNLLNLFFREVTIVPSIYGHYLPDVLIKSKFFGLPSTFLNSAFEKMLGPPFIKATCKI